MGILIQPGPCIQKFKSLKRKPLWEKLSRRYRALLLFIIIFYKIAYKFRPFLKIRVPIGNHEF